MDRKMIQTGLILIGIAVATTGFALHFLIPSTTRTGLPVYVQASSYTIENIRMELASTDYSFRIDILGLDQSIFDISSVYLLNATEFARYVNDTPIDELEPLFFMHNQLRGQFEMPVRDTLDLHLLIFNENDFQIMFGYYYVLLPSSFYETLTIGFMGLILILTGIGWFTSGWKRFFILGFGVNLILFYIRIFTLGTYSLGLPNVFEDIIQIELYNDYQFFYLSWIPNLWEGAWPYSREIYNYLYPPLWIYTMALLGSSPSWLPGVFLFAFNMGMAPLIYKISQSLTEDDRRSIFAMMLYLVNPISLFYGSFMWLNPTPYVFFVVLSFYLVLKGKTDYSIIALSVATLYKQFTIIFFPIIAILLIKQESQASLLRKLVLLIRYMLVYAIIIFMASIPFLVISPQYYLNQMILSGTGQLDRLQVFIPQMWMPVHFNTFFLWIGAPLWFTDLVAILIFYYVFLAICGLFVYVSYATTNPAAESICSQSARIKILVSKALFWAFVVVLCFQLFYPRGSYKFYLLALMPFAALIFDYDDFSLSSESPFKFQKRHLVPLLLSWLVFLCYRFVYFWVLIAWILFYLWKGGELSRIKRGLKSKFFSMIITGHETETPILVQAYDQTHFKGFHDDEWEIDSMVPVQKK